MTTTEVLNFFYEISASISRGCKINIPKIHKGLYINSQIRRDILCGENQGKICLSGSVRKFSFESMGGGVYRIFIPEN